jgi:hypothetical protein
MMMLPWTKAWRKSDLWSRISEAEQTYFKWATKSTHLNQTHVHQFYGTYKVHKNGCHSCPIVVNSTPEIFSKWVNHWLKMGVGSILPTYIRATLSTSSRNCTPLSSPVSPTRQKNLSWCCDNVFKYWHGLWSSSSQIIARPVPRRTATITASQFYSRSLGKNYEE